MVAVLKSLLALGLSLVALGLSGCDDKPASDAAPPTPGKGDAAGKYHLTETEIEAPAAPGRLVVEPQVLAFDVRLGLDGRPLDPTRSRRILHLANQGGTALFGIAALSSDPTFTIESACDHPVAPGQNCPLAVTWTTPREMDETRLILSYHVRPAQSGGEDMIREVEIAIHAQVTAAPAPEILPTPSLDQLRRKQIESARLGALEAQDRAAEAAAPAWGRNFPKAESSLPLDRTRIITTDRVINAVLERGVDSSVPGPVVAVVETNIYGADGRLVLIPAGSRIVGACRALANNAQYRVQIAFERVLRPDGAQILIGDPAADAMGRLGVPGELDQRLLDRAGIPLLVSLIGAVGAGLTALSGAGQAQVIGGGGIVTTQTGSVQAQALTQAGVGMAGQFTGFAQKLLDERADVRPVIRLAQGARILIVPTTDIWLNDHDLASAARTAHLQRLRLAEMTDEIEARIPTP